MAMTMVVTRNLPGRFHGFLASCMHEVAPGVYVNPRMRKAVRERVWKVAVGWTEAVPDDGGFLLLWKSRNAPSGLGLRLIGWPHKELVDHEGIWLTVGQLRKEHDRDELDALVAAAEAFEQNEPP